MREETKSKMLSVARAIARGTALTTACTNVGLAPVTWAKYADTFTTNEQAVVDATQDTEANTFSETTYGSDDLFLAIAASNLKVTQKVALFRALI